MSLQRKLAPVKARHEEIAALMAGWLKDIK